MFLKSIRKTLKIDDVWTLLHQVKKLLLTLIVKLSGHLEHPL